MDKLLPERLALLRRWVLKREEARVNKEAGRPKPWTDDPVLQVARFCNVRRMDDKVSRWLVDNWYPVLMNPTGKLEKQKLLAAAGLARLVNWPDALDGLRAPRSGVFREWDPKIATAHFQKIKAAGGKVFTGAYIINGVNTDGLDKIGVIIRQVNTLYLHPELLDSDSMQSTHTKLMQVSGIGSFIAGQLVADLRHVYPGPWRDAHRWAPVGPGSRRGLGWLRGWDGVAPLERVGQEEFVEWLLQVRNFFVRMTRDGKLARVWIDRQLEMHDLQNCLCEFDKYMRLTMGTGRAKNKFDGV